MVPEPRASHLTNLGPPIMPSDLTLLYGKKPIRAVLDHHGIWYSASDIYLANRRFTDRDCLSRIDPTHLRLHSFPAETGTVLLTSVTPAGALTIARWLPPKLDRIMDAWVRRETNRLAADHGLPPLGMELLPDHSLPVRPKVSHDLWVAWKDLQRDHRGYRSPRRRDEPALQDEDTNISPHDSPDAQGRSFLFLRDEAGDAEAVTA